MIIYGSIDKSGSGKIAIPTKDRLAMTGEKNIAIAHGGLCLNVIYRPDDNTRIIQTDNYLWISDDKIFGLDNGSFTETDYQSIIGALEDKGIDCIKDIQSNVTIFLYGINDGIIYLASNRITAGRMFYSFINDSLIFGNNFELFVRIKGDLSINPLSLYAYSKFGAVPEDITFDRSIKSVHVGHYAAIDLKGRKIEYIPFFKFNYNKPKKRKNEHNFLFRTESVLKNNAKAFSEKTVHIFISGGIDSSLFAFYLKELSANMIGHYCRFGESDPEQQYAESVAEALEIPLKIHTIDDDKIIDEIEDTAANTSYPFSDFSNISLNFLLRKIREEFGPGATVIECNGADDAFGYAALKNIPFWHYMHKIPKNLLDVLGNSATSGDSWMYHSLLRLAFFYLYRAREKNMYTTHMVSSAGEKVFRYIDTFNAELKELISRHFDNNLASNCPTDYERMNTAQFLHTCSHLWTAKGYSPSESMNLKIIYPFTWKNILELQSQLPMTMKIHNGEVKWPLKKLLEQFMPMDFIYRKKSGFAPPLLRWIKNDSNYNYFYNNIMNGVFIKYLKKDKINKIFMIHKSGKGISRYAMNLIWSLLFFEVWLKQNSIKIAE